MKVAISRMLICRLVSRKPVGKQQKYQWKDFDYEITVPDDMYFYGFYFQSDDGTTGDMYVDNMKIVKTAQPSKATDIPKLKDIYSDTFGVVAVGIGK